MNENVANWCAGGIVYRMRIAERYLEVQAQSFTVSTCLP